MIKLSRSVTSNYNYTVDFYVRKEAIIGVFDIQKCARIMLVSGETVEVNNTADEVLKLLEL